MNALDEVLGRRVSLRALALLRVLVGPLVVLHLRPFLDQARHGVIYRDAFYEPYTSWYPELPRGLYVAVLWLGVIAAVAMTLGVCTRRSTTTAFAVVAYNLFLSKTHMHNNRAFLVIVLAILAVAPCGRELSVDAWLARRRGVPLDLVAPALPLLLLRFEASVVYGASGVSKLVDPDWFGGTVTWDRMMRSRDHLATTPLPDWMISVMTDRSVHTFAAKVIVCTELLIAIGLWFRTTRYVAIWLAVLFHLAIELSANVQVFSYLAISALVIWAVPSTRDRVLFVDFDVPAQRRFARIVRVLDWLARFRVEPGPSGSALRVVDRDGTHLEGRAALTLTSSRLPVTAWFFLPATFRLEARRRVRARPRATPDTRAGVARHGARRWCFRRGTAPRCDGGRHRARAADRSHPCVRGPKRA